MNRVAGIYKIENRVNGKVYIGQSINIHNRIKCGHSERWEKNKHLKASYSKYGIENFTFSTIRVIKESPIAQLLLNCLERYYIDKYNSVDSRYGYNKKEGGDRDCLYSKESRLKMSNKAKERPPNRQKPVINLVTLEVYPSAAEAQRVSKSYIKEALRKGVPVKGYFWDYYYKDKVYSKVPLYKKDISSSCRKIVCLETGEVFESISSAKKSLTKGDLHKALNKRSLCGGFHWAYYDEKTDYKKNIFYGKNRIMKDTRVLCVETNTKYSSIRDAELSTGIHQSHISCCAHKKQLTAGGFHWRFCKDDENI